MPEPGFILSRHWDDVPIRSGPGKLRQLQLSYWVHTRTGPLQVVIDEQTAVCFLPAAQLPQAQTILERHLGRSVHHPAITPVWEARPVELRDFSRQPVVALYFREQRTLYRARDLLGKQGLTPLEADISPADRYLMERFITGPVAVDGSAATETAGDGYRRLRNPRLQPASYAPHFSLLSLDIETSMEGDHLYSIGLLLTHSHSDEREALVLMIGEGDAPADQPYLQFVTDEQQLMEQFLQWFQERNPDIIIGWNVVNFDLRFLQRKADSLRLRLALGRDGSNLEWRQSREDDNHYTVICPGRLIMDGIDTLRSATWNFESFALDAVAHELLGRGKLSEDVDHRGETITEQFLDDKPALAAYNLEDCQLVWDIFCHTRLLDFAIERGRLTGLALDRFGGSVAAFDHRYLPRLHRRGYVAPMLQENPEGVGSPGGYVMDSIPGLYENVLVLDFKSLYPSIMRTFKIDPLARVAGEARLQVLGVTDEPRRDRLETDNPDREQLVAGFNGAVFAKQEALLPDIIGELWAARDQAKAHGNGAMSQAIKIIMNSFYGVLGTPGCRFFDYRLPSSITLRGHQILTRSRQLIEAQGHQVIYGDTDSVFVRASVEEGGDMQQVGRELALYLNQWWREHLDEHYQLQSYLEIEFETHYRKFVMPTIRGAETGSKKRYAGLVATADGDKLVFKGLEAVRTDWTQKAREFQRELYRRVFAGEAFEDYIQQTLEEIRSGACDQQLVYRKRIRRPLAEYQRNVPPHVQAARKADEWLQATGRPPRYERGGWIRYLLTVKGPEPLEHAPSALDYDTYIERQIAPLANGILHFLDTSFEAITARQFGLFG
ncbi:DNA polymerase II [Pseudomaricurvus sp. HS19]|uniref:DNA polymerase II n=1 Tax=Pseudomaricurvus sp. HS19 TaxID=2692626 RepID=UPI00136D148F|nr:DNA polymerase II [Pseudomaricurvus sp. HS19]MYM62650.1 DNA polymerase II [Pseudomaricurvus sp. HS19]